MSAVRHATLRVPGLRVSLRSQLRTLAVLLIGTALLLVVAVLAIGLGSVSIPAGDVVAVLAGGGEPAQQFIVEQIRLPRVAVGALAGFCFGVSGAIFQNLGRNPLASPDILGIVAGASVGAMVVITQRWPIELLPVAALVGGVVAAILIYAISYRHGVAGYRLVLVGIGIGAIGTGLTTYLFTVIPGAGNADLLQRANRFIAGSLEQLNRTDMWIMVAVAAVLLPLTLIAMRQYEALQLDDDLARGLGVRVEPARAWLLAIAVALSAIPVAICGPITFLALIAPHIAATLVRSRSGALLLLSGLVGATLLVGCDLLSRWAMGERALPAGLLTAAIGAPYFLYLLYRANRVGWGD